VVRPKLLEVRVPTEDERHSAEPAAAGADDVRESSQAGGGQAEAEEAGAAVAESPDVVRLVERIADEVAGLRADFNARIRYDEVKERQITSMHEELQGFRAGLHLRLLQPMFTDLIGMHDDLVDALSLADASAELESFKGSVLETLSRNGVSSYTVDSDEVDTARQRVIRAVTTSDETLDRRVQRRVRVGFEYDNGKVLRPEWVVAYRYTRNAEPVEAVDAVPAAGRE
jgi:molecular chaperone GrpE